MIEVRHMAAVFLAFWQSNMYVKEYLDEHPADCKILHILTDGGMTDHLDQRDQIAAYLELAKADEYLTYFDQMYAQEQKDTAVSLVVNNSPEYMYSLKVEIDDDDLYPVLIEHKIRKNGGWTK